MREVLIRGRAFLIRGEEVNELLISDKVLRLRNFLSSFGAFREGRNIDSFLSSPSSGGGPNFGTFETS
jgi:hypothetical protein